MTHVRAFRFSRRLGRSLDDNDHRPSGHSALGGVLRDNLRHGASDGRAPMTVGTALFLIAVGAILRYAVTASVSGVSLATAGLILMIVGGAGLVISLFYIATRSPRRS
jgi:hypothetical protein